MQLLALGLNHNSAPLAIREQTSFAPEKVQHALKDIASSGIAREATILSTCNRTEIYAQKDDLKSQKLLAWVCDYQGLASRLVDDCIYQFTDQDAVKHTFRVASGLDSMVLGEPQILGQMKDAFHAARESGTIGKVLNRLFQQSFSVAKEVRTDTAIGAHAVSVAFAAVALAKQIFSELNEQTVLLIGAGETIELTAMHLSESKVKRIIVANRTTARAAILAERINGLAIPLTEIPYHLAHADIVISSTASPLPILGKGSVERALKQRKHQPMFMVDLAVPRDIEAEVADLDDIYLYTVDDLKNVVDSNMANRRQAAQQAEQIIDLQVLRFMRWMNEQDVVPTIRGLRASMDEIRQIELQKAQRRLQAGAEPQEILEQLANSLTNKFCHRPSTALREAGHEGNTSLLAAVRKMFDLKDQTK